MEIDEVETYNGLSDYLLERMDFADDEISKANPSFTREQMWNMYIGDCIKYDGQPLPIRTKSIFMKTIKKDFNQII